MTKQVTTTFSVTIRSLWHVSIENPLEVLDEEGNLVAAFVGSADAQSCCTDHNRTTRQRAKQREHRKADAKSGHADHSEDTDDEETEINKNPALKQMLVNMLPKGKKKAN